MYHHQVYIHVWDCRAAVARYVRLDAGTMTMERAANWQALEGDAEKAVDAAGGWITQSGHYPCPEQLAARAVWRDGEAEPQEGES